MNNEQYFRIKDTVVMENGKVCIVPKLEACKKPYDEVAEAYKLYKERVSLIKEDVYNG